VITVRFEGGQELLKALDTLSARVSRTVQREALKAAAEPMRKRMATLAPYEPGKPDLRDTLAISNARADDDKIVSIKVGPTRHGFYGSFLEFGTAEIAPRPWMRPAFDETVKQALAVLRAELWTALASRGIQRTATSEVPVSAPGGGGLL